MTSVPEWRARERNPPPSPPSFPFPSLPSVTARACVNRCTRVGYIDFKRHAARLYISRRRISYSHKRNGDPLLAGNFYRWKCIVPVFFSCEKYEYIRRKMLIVYESFTRIIGSKNFFKKIYIYISFELKVLLRAAIVCVRCHWSITKVALRKMSRMSYTRRAIKSCIYRSIFLFLSFVSHAIINYCYSSSKVSNQMCLEVINTSF